MMSLFVSCGIGGLNGTYIPKNKAAEQMMFSKFIFSGNKVKCYMGMMGMALPVAYEYSYSLKGNTVSFEAGIPGMQGILEFNFDKDKQEISLLTGMNGGAMDSYLPIWGKEGTFDPNAPQPNQNTSQVQKTEGKSIPNDQTKETKADENKKEEISDETTNENCIKTLATPEMLDTLSEASGGNTVSFSWKTVINAQDYIVNWKLDNSSGTFKTNNNTFASITLPTNIMSTMYIDIYACGSFCNKWVQSSSPANFSIKIEKSESITIPPNGGIYSYNVSKLASIIGSSYPICTTFIPIEQARKIKYHLADNEIINVVTEKGAETALGVIGTTIDVPLLGEIVFLQVLQNAIEKDFFSKCVDECKDGGFIEETLYAPNTNPNAPGDGILPYRAYSVLDGNFFTPTGKGNFTPADQLNEGEINNLYKQ